MSLKAHLEKLLLGKRRSTYLTVFKPGDRAAQEVLADLSAFCGMTKPPLEQITTERPGDLARMEGRREVLVRILRHINMDVPQLMEIYSDSSRSKAALVQREADDFDYGE